MAIDSEIRIIDEDALLLPQAVARRDFSQLQEEKFPLVHLNFPHPAARPPGFKNVDLSYELVIPIKAYLALCQAAIFANKRERKEHRRMVIWLMTIGVFSEKGEIDFTSLTRFESLYLHMTLLATWQKWETTTDAMLALSYTMLRDRIITREESFFIAAHQLDDNPPKSANSWRVRVDAYAKNRGLPAIGQPLRKRHST